MSGPASASSMLPVKALCSPDPASAPPSSEAFLASATNPDPDSALRRDLINGLPDEVLLMIFQAFYTSDHAGESVRLRLVCRKWNAFTRSQVCTALKINYEDFAYLHELAYDRRIWESLGRVQHLCRNLYINLKLLKHKCDHDKFKNFSHPDPKVLQEVHEMELRYFPVDYEVERYRERKGNALSGNSINAVLKKILAHSLALSRCRVDLPQSLARMEYDDETHIATFALGNILLCLARCIRHHRRQSTDDNAEPGDKDRPFHKADVVTDSLEEENIHSDDEDKVTGNDPSEVKLETLIITGMFETVLHRLWRNPMDHKNMRTVMRNLKHLDIEISLIYQPNASHTVLWPLMKYAPGLESLCLSQIFRHGMEVEPSHMFYPIPETRELWASRALPNPSVTLENLTSLELRHVNIFPSFFKNAIVAFGASLKELYLDTVTLFIEDEDLPDSGVLRSSRIPKQRWIGFPGVRPQKDYIWVAMFLRENLPNLERCRASNLDYCVFGIGNSHPGDGAASSSAFSELHQDLGMTAGRTISQIFSEVVNGIEQPLIAKDHGFEGRHVFLPYSADNDERILGNLKPRPQNGDIAPQEYDHDSYIDSGGVTPSCRSQQSLDGVFPNSTGGTANMAWERMMHLLSNKSNYNYN
ncbi:hypothetical protein HOO65_070414 [Ceratocystis lukuohia]|uniref:F-box domain-containing protein n=1 Tax=Ceratocystis lukuohia TaxID=2019550 RepID=A0ABR4MCF0_9PEZI